MQYVLTQAMNAAMMMFVYNEFMEPMTEVFQELSMVLGQFA